MKFLHLADLHLDSPLRAQAARNPEMGEALRDASRRVLSAIVERAIEHRVDAVLLAGDTFDSGVADVAARAALAAAVSRLAGAGIPAVLIQGNHDAMLDLGRFGPMAGLTQLTPEAPSVEIGEAVVHGMGFTTPHMRESLLPRYPAPVAGKFNIGLMHSSLDGSPGHDPYAPCALGDLLAHGYDYWALGHIHKRSEHRGERSLAVMPGIPQGRSVRETEGGSVTLVELDLDGVRATPLPVELLRFARLPVALDGCEDASARLHAIRTALGAAMVPGVLLAARLDLVGSASEIGDLGFATEQARQEAAELDGVFIEKVRAQLRQGAQPDGAAGDIAQAMRADAATPGFRDEARALLADWRSALPRDIADLLDEDQLDALIDEGIETMALRLGAGNET
ncbi:DNA repair exonuclease [Salipiger sp. 1_MG-2023]|uniref:metallophosphoesterase family protein n=1 Tax=Salipiger sp. 1_MG-2023 TaxID=3062665 RepID=UPI0026E3260C|nr:DNA repair exonuclease [Salipiger sp. 1_MG-2023]MDO6586703.1 DNA repair exonuclease [Salipiger sp. 1_MG-2023]